MEEYNFKAIENKWQKIWEENNYGIAKDFANEPKFYNLVEFPYPSGYGLHVGHCMGYGASDAFCRMKRMQGENVMFPIGWDAFGLPTENFAIKNKVSPQQITKEAIATFKKQMKSLGYSFDWSREIDTTDPNYYKWTQWIFLQFYKHAYIDGKLIEVADDDKNTPRMAYQAEMPVNWCPSCKIVLANEEVIGGNCERCGAASEKRKQKQWVLRITAYADRLIEDLNKVDYLDKIKTQQINWIGKSTGSEIDFKIKNRAESIKVFTTRADTLYGCTYVVLAPEHALVNELKEKAENPDEIDEYINKAKTKSDLERTELEKEKTGVELRGIKVINPINNREVSVWIADYVLASYGTGAVMAVPAHDERDFEFAKKYGIDIIEVIIPGVSDIKNPPRDGVQTVERKAVHALIRDPKTDKYLCFKWKDFNWGLTFVAGGIENGENPEEAARREILEETGYKNLKFIKRLGGPVRSEFYAKHKEVNRIAYFEGVLFELENDEKTAVTDEMKDKFDIVWMNLDELNLNNMTCAEIEIWKERIKNPETKAFTDYGFLVNSNDFNGLPSEEAKTQITKKLKDLSAGDFAVNFKLRDWIFSRQHYWGEPIPIIHCDKCGMVPVAEAQLPVTLPLVENYQPTDTGESPLAAITDWVNIACPNCGGDAHRETDTMPNWAGSSWYFLRYCDPHENKSIATKDKLDYWMPVDLYNGGMEHTTLHLLYSRFWHKFLFDLGAVPGPEPYSKRIAHGIILGPDGQKMSKSKGNVINPDEMVDKFGADTLRAYIMFIGPYDQESAWSNSGIQGVNRFLKRVWNNFSKISEYRDSDDILVKLHQTIKGVTDDLENFQLNTVISKLMEMNNRFEKEEKISKYAFKRFLQLLFTACPHIASELWEMLGEEIAIDKTKWPDYDEKYLVSAQIPVAVQINGKTRQIIEVKSDIDQKEIEKIALADGKVKDSIGAKEVIKTIYIAGRVINFVVK